MVGLIFFVGQVVVGGQASLALHFHVPSATCTIHLMPNLSAHIPNFLAKNVFSNGMITDPPSASFENAAAALASSSVRIPIWKLSPGLPARSGGASMAPTLPSGE